MIRLKLTLDRYFTKGKPNCWIKKASRRRWLFCYITIYHGTFMGSRNTIKIIIPTFDNFFYAKMAKMCKNLKPQIIFFWATSLISTTKKVCGISISCISFTFRETSRHENWSHFCGIFDTMWLTYFVTYQKYLAISAIAKWRSFGLGILLRPISRLYYVFLFSAFCVFPSAMYTLLLETLCRKIT